MSLEIPEQKRELTDAQKLVELQNYVFNAVEASLSAGDRKKMPAGPERVGYLIGKALENVQFQNDEFSKNLLVGLIKNTYKLSSTGERFIFDPHRKSGPLIVDERGDIVALQGAKIGTISKDLEGAGTQYVESYMSSKMLTGPDRGKEFTPQQRPIPEMQLMHGELGYEEHKT